MAGRPPRYPVSVRAASSDGQYWGRWWAGDKPAFYTALRSGSSMVGPLSTQIRLGSSLSARYGLANDLSTGSGGESLSWQLATGHYVQAQISPTIIHPRPDGETNAYERHRLAPDSIPWRIPVVVQGGAWPFEYAVTSAPSGVTIGRHYGDSDYGVMSWASPTIGSHIITVRVRTQDYGRTSGSADSTGEYSVTFSLSVVDKNDTSKFIWMATSGNDSNAGTYSSPIASLVGFQSKSIGSTQFFVRSGTYSNQSLSTDLYFIASSRSTVIVGYPGETVVFDVEGSNIRNFYLQADGGFVGNIKTTGGTSTSGDIWHWNAAGDRMTLFESNPDGLHDSAGSGSFANHSGWTMFADSNIHRYVSLVNNTFSDFTTITNGGGSIWYSVTYGVFEGNTITGMNLGGSTEGFRTKGRCAYVTTRNNRAPTAQSFGQAVLSHYQGTDGNQGDTPNYNELCWNYVRQGASSDGASWYGAATYAPWTGYSYRNTLLGECDFSAWSQTCSLLLQENVLLNHSGNANDNSGSPVIGLTITDTNNIKSVFANAATTVDANGLLLSAYLTANGLTRGTRGHEVA